MSDHFGTLCIKRLRVEIFFEKEREAENGGIYFAHLPISFALGVEQNFMQSIAVLFHCLFVVFGDKKYSL